MDPDPGSPKRRIRIRNLAIKWHYPCRQQRRRCPRLWQSWLRSWAGTIRRNCGRQTWPSSSSGQSLFVLVVDGLFT